MKYRKIGSAYQVQEGFFAETLVKDCPVIREQYYLRADGKLYIDRYYAWDGPSGGINTKTFIKSSCVHDVLCELINDASIPVENQPMADKTMLLLNKKAGMWMPRRLWTYTAVRLYQAKKKHLTGKPKVYEV